MAEAGTPHHTREFSGKIEGWLTFFVIVQIISMVIVGLDLVGTHLNLNDYPVNIQSDVQNYLNTARLFDIAYLLASVFAFYLIFTKSLFTRRYMIWFMSLTILAAFSLYSMLDNIIQKAGGDTSSNSSVITVGTIVWLIYWIRSKRVKETFIK